jgi:hypothetical protein
MKRLKMLVTGKLVNSVSNNFAKIIVSPFKFFAPNLSELTCMQAELAWRFNPSCNMKVSESSVRNVLRQPLQYPL